MLYKEIGKILYYIISVLHYKYIISKKYCIEKYNYRILC